MFKDGFEKLMTNRNYNEFGASSSGFYFLYYFILTYLLQFSNGNNICDTNPTVSMKKTRAPPPPFKQTYKVIFYLHHNFFLLHGLLFRIYQSAIMLTHKIS